MEDITYPKQILDYRPIAGRRPGRPLKKLTDGYNRETEKVTRRRRIRILILYKKHS
jgi:hypothetical protein